MNDMKDRIYVCHTFYHVYVALLKEYNLPKEKHGNATIVLSKMSTDFGDFDVRLRKNPMLEDVIIYDEKRDVDIPEVWKYHEYQKNPIKRIIYRIKYTKAYGKSQEKLVPVDFKEYKEIYVFCDSDPIGFYLNYKHIYYHSVEDGLNSIRNVDHAHFDNQGGFAFKAFMSKLNLFFIQNGYGRYCIDVEVNELKGIAERPKNMIEVPRKQLELALNEEQKQQIIDTFVSDITELTNQVSEAGSDKYILILTEPLCTDLNVRHQLFADLIEKYEKEGKVIIKPHPRDELNYYKEFPDYMVIAPQIPMEILNFLAENFFEKVVSIYTDINGIRFAKIKERLGHDFMDKYEEPEIHRKYKDL